MENYYCKYIHWRYLTNGIASHIFSRFSKLLKHVPVKLTGFKSNDWPRTLDRVAAGWHALSHQLSGASVLRGQFWIITSQQGDDAN